MSLTDTDRAAIRSELSAILSSRLFASSKRLKSFLTFITESTLAGQANSLKEYVIATDVYERDAAYNPQVDSTVRVEASRLRAKLHEYYAAAGARSVLRIELPKGAYVPVFARAMEETEDGHRNRLPLVAAGFSA